MLKFLKEIAYIQVIFPWLMYFTMDFLVFDRWGNKIVESQNTDNGWDGTSKGLPMNPGTYMWYVKATMLDGTSIEKHGNVALVR